jgi:L-ascorbate metabolism protein UlaG (beta-lactamase superfamily)
MAVEEPAPFDAVHVTLDHFGLLEHSRMQRHLRAVAPRFITPSGVGAHLKRWGVPPECVLGLDCWEERTQLSGFRLCLGSAPSRSSKGARLLEA